MIFTKIGDLLLVGLSFWFFRLDLRYNDSGYSYNVDTGKSGKTGQKVEPSHIDVNYPNPEPKNVPNKKKLPIKDY